MAFLRVLAWVLLLAAAIALVSDFTRTGTTGSFVGTSILAHWKALSPQSLASAAATVQKSIHPLAWDPLIVRILILPAWLVMGAFAVLCGVLGRKKRRINIYAN
jgi:hypothetical protein